MTLAAPVSRHFVDQQVDLVGVCTISEPFWDRALHLDLDDCARLAAVKSLTSTASGAAHHRIQVPPVRHMVA
jgi:hypothetical protein